MLEIFSQIRSNEKVFIAIPLGIVFFSNIAITQIKGLAFIGELAVIGGFCNLVAILIGLRTDIQILSQSKYNAQHNLSEGISAILCLILISLPCILLVYYVGAKIEHIIIGFLSTAIALNEITSSFFLRASQFYFYSFLRSLPSILILLIVLYVDSPAKSWIICYSAMLIVLTYILYKEFKRFGLSLNISFKPVAHYIKSKILPTLTALLCATGSVFWLFTVSEKVGPEAAGIWSNVIRIFSLPIILMTAIHLPLVILKVGNLDSSFQKIKVMHKFTYKFFLLSSLILIISFLWGENIFSFFTATDRAIPSSILLLIVGFCILKNFLGYHQSIFQALEIDHILFFILSLELLLATFLYFEHALLSFDYISNFIFLSVLVCSLLLTFFLFKFTFKYRFSDSK